jgi:hypothetical protein
MPTFDLDGYVARSDALDLDATAWDEMPRHPLPPGAVRTLGCMQDEETFHGIALRRFLEAAGHPPPPRVRPRGQEPWVKRIEAAATATVSKAWPDFCAVHMTWGAINELTTRTATVRLLEAWMDRFVDVSPPSIGGSHGDRDR